MQKISIQCSLHNLMYEKYVKQTFTLLENKDIFQPKKLTNAATKNRERIWQINLAIEHDKERLKLAMQSKTFK